VVFLNFVAAFYEKGSVFRVLMAKKVCKAQLTSCLRELELVLAWYFAESPGLFFYILGKRKKRAVETQRDKGRQPETLIQRWRRNQIDKIRGLYFD